MELIKLIGGIIIGVDTNAIRPPGVSNIYSDAFGDFKHVLGEQSPRNYSITYCENNVKKHLKR